MTAVAAETPQLAGKDLEVTGELPEALEREPGRRDEPVAVTVRDREPDGAGGAVAQLGESRDSGAGKPANAGCAGSVPTVQAGEAAEQLAAAVTAALRPDAAPLDYAPCRQGVGAAVQRLRGALLGLIRELEPRTAATVPDSATARAQHLAADIRFVRPLELH